MACCDTSRAELLAAALLIRGVTAEQSDALDGWLREGGKCECPDRCGIRDRFSTQSNNPRSTTNDSTA
jgi:hypothetical protein